MEILHEYIPSRKDDSPTILIHKNAKYPLVKLDIPKGMHLMEDILPNLKKHSFADHDLWKFLEI